MLASAESSFQSAVLQAFPSTATSHIPVLERLLGISPRAGATNEARRREILARFARKTEPSLAGLRNQMRSVDERLRLLVVPFERAGIVYYGRAFREYGVSTLPYGAGPFSPPSSATRYPAHTTVLKLVLFLDQGGLPPTDAQEAVLQRAAKILWTALPSNVTFHPSVSQGFRLDETPLDLNSLD